GCSTTRRRCSSRGRCSSGRTSSSPTSPTTSPAINNWGQACIFALSEAGGAALDEGAPPLGEILRGEAPELGLDGGFQLGREGRLQPAVERRLRERDGVGRAFGQRPRQGPR